VNQYAKKKLPDFVPSTAEEEPVFADHFGNEETKATVPKAAGRRGTQMTS